MSLLSILNLRCSSIVVRLTALRHCRFREASACRVEKRSAASILGTFSGEPNSARPFPAGSFLPQESTWRRFVGSNLIQSDPNPEIESSTKLDRTSQQQADLGRLRSIELVEGAVVAPMSLFLWRVRRQAGIARFVARSAQCTRNRKDGSSGHSPAKNLRRGPQRTRCPSHR